VKDQICLPCLLTTTRPCRIFRIAFRNGIRDVYPGSEFFHPGSRVEKIDGSASKNLSILTPKIFSKLSEMLSRMLIPDPDPESSVFYPSRIPDPGIKTAPDPGSGTATLRKFIENIHAFNHHIFF
jgi:hypothetical protein